jgi:hypothetical protein
LPEASRSLQRVFGPGTSIVSRTAGWPGSVTSITLKHTGADSLAMERMRRPSAAHLAEVLAALVAVAAAEVVVRDHAYVELLGDARPAGARAAARAWIAPKAAARPRPSGRGRAALARQPWCSRMRRPWIARAPKYPPVPRATAAPATMRM